MEPKYLNENSILSSAHLFQASSLDFNSNFANHLELVPICQICSIYFWIFAKKLSSESFDSVQTDLNFFQNSFQLLGVFYFRVF